MTTRRYCIVGATLTGNLGGASMLLATLDELGSGAEPCTFDLLSVYPRQDRRANQHSGLRIIAVPPLLLVGIYFPLACLVWPLAYLRAGRALLSLLPAYRSLLEATVVVDLSGIAFVDGRGLAVLLYNLACSVPAMLFGKRVAKLAQTLGPFKSTINRWCAGCVLRRCSVLIARGRTSGRHLQELGLERFVILPDTSFAMRSTPEAAAAARAILAAAGIGDRPRLFASPSQVVATACERQGVDYYGVMAALLAYAHASGLEVVLLPHSHVSRGSRNNDRQICECLLARLPADVVAIYLDGDYDARTARALIGHADVFVGSRFHGMISALVGGVPLIVIGWSHKYTEMLDEFGLGEWAIDWRSLSTERLTGMFAALRTQSSAVQSQIQGRRPGVVARAKQNFELVRRLSGAQG